MCVFITEDAALAAAHSPSAPSGLAPCPHIGKNNVYTFFTMSLQSHKCVSVPKRLFLPHCFFGCQMSQAQDRLMVLDGNSICKGNSPS